MPAPAYQTVKLQFVSTDAGSAQMHPAACADIQYWLDGTEAPFEADDRLAVRTPGTYDHVTVAPNDDVEFGVLALPRDARATLGLMLRADIQEFLFTAPTYGTQVERFYA